MSAGPEWGFGLEVRGGVTEVRGINPPAFTQHRIGLRIGLELIGR